MSARKESAKGKKAIINLAQVAGIYLLAFFVLEAAARFYYSAPWYEALIGQEKHLDIDNTKPYLFPLRHQYEHIDKKKGERRILILGDSMSFGSAVDNEKEIFPSLLKERLNRELPNKQGQHIEIFNGGMPGSLTDDWLALWNRISNDYQPDVLLLVFFLRDGTKEKTMAGYFNVIRNDILMRNRKSYFYHYSFLYRVFRDLFDRRIIAKEYSRYMINGYFGTDDEQLEWRKAQANLVDLKIQAEKRGITVGLVIFPVLVELETENYPFKKICSLLEDFASQKRFRYYNLLPDYLGKNAPSLWAASNNQHPNEVGHKIAADALYPFVRQLLEDHKQNPRTD